MDTSRDPKRIVNPPMSFGKKRWTEIDKKVVFAFFVLHFLCIFAPFQMNRGALSICFALFIITGLFGITISYHRNLSHKSFKIPKWLEYSFAYCGVHAFQGDPINWVSTHRYHHQFVDTEQDPHSPIHGFWFSYITWFLYESNGSISEMIGRHRKLDNACDLEKQTFYRFIRETYVLHPIALALILYGIGGLPYFIWGTCVRTVMLLHTTYLVNSLCHMWGKQPWKTNDLSTNNWCMSFLAFGEGWHNNHHAFEYSARMGIEWWQYDPGWYVIVFLQAIGVATHVKLPSQTHMQKLAKEYLKEAFL
ncbi:palmitoyl-monogalactosyldiacylglycerol delta-7 desaturase, chloroplastic-like [Cucurbita pepo subsp. pepo]|uniref:palmitoyl-monogalactosyldiacylglycerol delta-7 desaturase, chloroplastic-like n=1 Tax=Cucurbita pepo subsp. pepo TaxID=3664 RepID=UPI000C9D8687|nr:palmitoyl-monogalactosyldiacylglycerol delta-7 desaturase, chloroplastic-like [Cucurbita pepo subsp. pepo]